MPMKVQANGRFRVQPSLLLPLFVTAVYAVTFVVLYRSSYAVMVSWWEKDDYMYAYMIPFVMAYLVWEGRDRLKAISASPSWLGLVPLSLGIGLYLLGEFGGEFFALYLSSWLVTVGLCWIHLGWEKLKRLGFVLIVMLTMFPLPDFAYKKLSVTLQLVSSQLGAALIRLFGVTAHREGNIIDLGFTQLQVVEACNGIRYLIPLIVLSLILSHFFRGSLWKKAVIIASAIPLAVGVNALRIGLAGILGAHWGTQVIEGFFHDLSGWVIFMISFAVIVLEMRLLGRVGKPRPAPPPAGVDTPPIPDSAKAPGSGRAQESPTRRGRFAWPKAAVAISLLLLTVPLSRGVEFREETPAIQSFAACPLQVGEWRGTRLTLEPDRLKALYFSDYVMVDFTNPQGRTINFYVAYYAGQSKGKAIHTPATCLPGSGWVFAEDGIATVPSPGYGSGSIQVSRALMEKLNSRQLSYYWFPQRGRILTDLYQLKLYAFWDALTRGRTDGALVRVIMPVGASEPIEKSEAVLQDFTRQVLPILDRYIPGAQPPEVTARK